MPGFATSARTLDQARRLMAAVGCTAHEIDIRPSCEQMLHDIGHPYAAGEPVYDVTFENVQAGERTSHLFRLANFNSALVVGTGDLSELALGWSTYGVGDHMSHYNVNASVPKTLIKHLVRWVAETRLGRRRRRRRVLDDILATEISPELVPGDGSSDAARRRATRGDRRPVRAAGLPPLLHPALRLSRRRKVAFLAWTAWHDADARRLAGRARASRATPTRSARSRSTCATFVVPLLPDQPVQALGVPNAPKVGSGGSLSPRGDWRAPSDGEATVWLEDVERIPDA